VGFFSSVKPAVPQSTNTPYVPPIDREPINREPVGANTDNAVDPAVGGDPTQPPQSPENHGADEPKRQAVKEAFLFAWNGYVKHAWGEDELHPIDGTSSNWIGLGLTITDSLDTIWIMGLDKEFKMARDWIASRLDFNKNREVSLFETTIRVLGGLLSAYELSGDQIFLDKAKDLGDRFLPAFNTPTGIPRCSVNLQTGYANNPSWTGGASVLSEVGTIQLEFTYLSEKTGIPTYREKVTKVFDVLEKANKHSGLYSVYVSPESGQFTRNHITLGALGDSFYEYLIKLYILTGKEQYKWRNMYDDAVGNIIEHLVHKSNPSKLTYIAELIGGQTVPKMDHLVCFAGAMFALGAEGKNKERDLNLGAEITRTCYEMYHRTATGIAPELVRFEGDNDFTMHSSRHYLLRPETVEAFFVLWRTTHDQKYRDWGWEVFQAINKHCRTTYGFSGIRDVNSPNPTHDNLQQSFFLAETLKYLYLLFSEDSLIPLDKYVFNTEAHPLGVLK